MARRALVIGNSAYKGERPLKNPVNDAIAFRDVLKKYGFDVTLRLDVELREFQSLVVQFGKDIKGAETALLFFAGHGFQIDDLNYLLPVDIEVSFEDLLKYHAIPLADFLKVMGGAHTGLIFLDACRDDPFIRSLSRRVAIGETTRRGGLSRGLASVRVSKGQFIAFAAEKNEVAYDGGEAEHSPFTEALLRHIGFPGQSIGDMMALVSKYVDEKTNGKQSPWYESNLREIFRFNATAPDEYTHWQTLSRLPASVSKIEAFITQFPNGTLASDARALFEERLHHVTNCDELEDFLGSYGESERQSAVLTRLATLTWATLRKSRDVGKLRNFAARFRETLEFQFAYKRLADLEWRRVRRSITPADLVQYVVEFPHSKHFDSALKRLNALQRDKRTWRQRIQVSDSIVDPERFRRKYHTSKAFKSLLAAGVIIAFALFWPSNDFRQLVQTYDPARKQGQEKAILLDPVPELGTSPREFLGTPSVPGVVLPPPAQGGSPSGVARNEPKKVRTLTVRPVESGPVGTAPPRPTPTEVIKERGFWPAVPMPPPPASTEVVKNNRSPTSPKKDDSRVEASQQNNQPMQTIAPGLAAVAQKVALYEEDPPDPNGKRFVGSAIWRTETVTPGPGQPPELAIRADVEVPERKLAMTWSLRRNTNKGLPASHTVEIMFKLPADFPAGGISNVPGILMKQAESTRGVPLAGLAIKVTNGFYLFALSSADADKERNLQLLKERGWFDIPVIYNNNRRAILALEKGTPGERAFADAFKAWKQ
jgi:hypothetical protein